MKKNISLIVLAILISISSVSAKDSIGKMEREHMMTGTGMKMEKEHMMTGTGMEMEKEHMMTGTGMEMKKEHMMTGTGMKMEREHMMTGTGMKMEKEQIKAKYNQTYSKKYGKIISQMDETKVKILIGKIDALVITVNTGKYSEETKVKLLDMIGVLSELANNRLKELQVESDLNLDSLFQ